jgi:hypothetical protein
MSKPLISWSKAHRDKAKQAGKGLVAYGWQEGAGRGGMQAAGPCDERAAQIICMFALRVHHGMPIDQAFADVKEAVEAFDKRQVEKKEGTDS